MAQVPKPPQGLEERPEDRIAFEQRLGDTLPLDATFLDDTGKQVRIGDYLGDKPVVLAMVYYRCPMLCIMTINGLLDSLRQLPMDAGKEFNVVLVSIDPRETPKVAAEKKEYILKNYDHPGAANGWHLLTGEDEQIRRVADAVGFKYAYDQRTEQFAHAAGVILVAPDGRLSRYFYGVDFPSRDMRLGLVEASNNTIGSAVDQVLLRCFHYDPNTGKYTFRVMAVIRVAGVLTVALMAGSIVILVRKTRRRT
ncbi:MAG: SCO family protein [Phycisphaeraceae bacterium]